MYASSYLKHLITQTEAFFSPFSSPSFSNIAVPSGAQNVSVLILSRLFPLDSHCIHTRLCLPQMIQTPKKPTPWRTLVKIAQPRAASAASETVSLFPQRCQKPRLARELVTHCRHVPDREGTGAGRPPGAPARRRYRSTSMTTSPALCALPQQQRQRSSCVLVLHPGHHVCTAKQSHRAQIWH